MLTKQLAEEIVEQTMLRLSRNLNVMDTNGMILASGDRARIDSIHEGAAYVAEKGESLWIHNNNLEEWPGSKPGVNMPVHYKSRLVGVIGITGSQEELRDVATLVQLTTEMMVHQSLMTSESEWKRKARELVFKELVSGHPPSGATSDRMSMLSISLTGPFTVLVVRQKEVGKIPNRLAESLVEVLGNHSVLSGPDDGNVLPFLLWGMDRKMVKKRVDLICKQRGISIHKVGIGRTVELEKDIAVAYGTAVQALQFSSREEIISDYEDVEMTALMVADQRPLHAEYVFRLLGSLKEPLLETLQTYLTHEQHAKEASAALGIHRHTLAYRLKRIEELTNLNPTRFTDAVQLYYAMLLKKGAETN